MSKIIKAGEDDSSVRPFDFRSIEGVAAPRLVKTQSNPGNEPEPLPEPEEADPIAELEAMLQTRLHELERRAEEVEREAYEKGYSQGEKDGAEIGLKSMGVVKEHLEQLFEVLNALPSRVLGDYREWLTATCIAATKQLVRRELETRPDDISRIVEAVLSDAVEHHTIAVYLNPKDLELVRNHVKEIEEQTGRTFTLKPDAAIERGGCRLESDLQLVDATIESRFKLLEQALRGDTEAAE
ncbi:MAG: FliH/SctL family protein [Acidobacteriota bacterium]